MKTNFTILTLLTIAGIVAWLAFSNKLTTSYVPIMVNFVQLIYVGLIIEKT